MQESYCVYKHTNTINNKVYIGITKQDVEKRWDNGRGYIKCTLFNRAIEKYGWDAFTHEILEVGLSREEANQKEKELIQQYQSTNPEYGYNICPGGGGGPKDFSAMTEWARANKKFGQDNVNSKRVRCKETGDVFGSIQEANRWCGASHGKITMCCRNERKHAGKHPETNIPLSWELVDNDTPVTIICNEIVKEPGHIKPILCIETGVIYPSATAAAKAIGLKFGSGILKCCSGERQTAGKMHWQFYNEGE